MIFFILSSKIFHWFDYFLSKIELNAVKKMNSMVNCNATFTFLFWVTPSFSSFSWLYYTGSLDPNMFWTLKRRTKIVFGCVRLYDGIIHLPHSSNMRRPKFDELFFSYVFLVSLEFINKGLDFVRTLWNIYAVV